MRLPFLQVESDLLAHGVDSVATLLQCEPVAALGHVAFLRAWAVSRASDDAPPDGWVPGANAARLVAAGARWAGDAVAFVVALADPGVALLEIQPDGIKVLKLEPYREAWGRNAKSRERLRKHRERNANETRTEVDGNANVSGQTQTQTQTQKEETTNTLSLSSDLFAVEPTAKEAPEHLRALWNENAHPSLPRWRDMTDKRRKAATARLSERPLAEWAALLQRINASSFCTGGGSTGWKADVEFFLRPDTATRILEGKYDDRGDTPTSRQQEVWDGLQRDRRTALEQYALPESAEMASPEWIIKALEPWAHTRKGDGAISALRDAWEAYAAKPQFQAKGLPVKLFLSPSVLAECVREVEAEEKRVADLSAGGVR